MYCYYKCSVALPHGTVAWFAVCDCGISWSYSHTFNRAMDIRAENSLCHSGQLNGEKINGLQAKNVLLYKSFFFLTLKMGDISWPCAMNMSEPLSTDLYREPVQMCK